MQNIVFYYMRNCANVLRIGKFFGREHVLTVIGTYRLLESFLSLVFTYFPHCLLGSGPISSTKLPPRSSSEAGKWKVWRGLPLRMAL